MLPHYFIPREVNWQVSVRLSVASFVAYPRTPALSNTTTGRISNDHVTSLFRGIILPGNISCNAESLCDMWHRRLRNKTRSRQHFPLVTTQGHSV